MYQFCFCYIKKGDVIWGLPECLGQIKKHDFDSESHVSSSHIMKQKWHQVCCLRFVHILSNIYQCNLKTTKLKKKTINKQYASCGWQGVEMCLDFCPGTLFVPRGEQFFESFEEQIMCKFKHTFTLNGGYCVYYLSNIFCNMLGFENWGISLGYSPVEAGEYSVDQS